jgi:hypothetical protein
MPIDWLIFAGFNYCDGKERESDMKISYSGALSLVTFLGFSYCDKENVFYV